MTDTPPRSPAPEPPPDDEDDYEDDPERECFWCRGEGVSECRNLLECCADHNSFNECVCSSCGGSGLAKDMTIW